LQARSRTWAVDRGKHGFFDLFKLIEKLHKPMAFCSELRRIPFFLEILYIAAGGKGATRARYDDHADLITGLKLADQPREILAHLDIYCIEAIGPVERDGRYAVGNIECDGFVGHVFQLGVGGQGLFVK
jgi:hypothetical protein